MKKKLTNNLGLKLMALLVAVVLWFISTNINDPIKTEVYKNIPITLVNKEYVTGKGKVVELLDESNHAAITVTARRSIIEKINEDDITASVDLKEVDTEADMATTMLQVRCSTARYSERQLENIESNPEFLKVRVENLSSKQIVIQTEVTGEPEEGFIVGKVSTDQNMMSVSGPESIVSQIASAKVTLDVTGQNSSINIKRNVELLDRKGDRVESSTLTKSIESVIVNATLLETKQVPVIFSTTGEPADGYVATGQIEADPAMVLIAGRSSYIRSVNRIEIPEAALDITGQQANMVTTVDIRQYLPEELTLADGSFNGKINVVVHIEKIEEKEISISAADIRFANVPEGYEVVAEDEEETWTVSVSGLQEDLNAVNAEGTTGYIDVAKILEQQDQEEAPAGKYREEISLELPAGVDTANAPVMRFSIIEVE